MKSKIYNIQALRGIAVLLVVLYHILPVEKKYNSEFIIVPEVFKLGTIGVDIFFIISGFIMFVVTENYHKSVKKYFKFMYSRLSRIYPLYWFFSLLILPVLFLKPEWVNSSQDGDVNLISSFLLFPTESKPLIMVAWSLIHEIYFYIVYGVLLLFLRRSQIGVFCISWFVLIIGLNLFFDFENPLILLITDPLTIEFIIGVLLGLFYIKTTNKSFISSNFLLRLPFILFPIMYVLFLDFFENESLRVITFGLPSLILVYCALELEKKRVLFNKFLIQIGDASYSIYLSHVLVLNVVGKILVLFNFQGFLFEILMVITMFFLAIVFGLLNYRFIEKPMLLFFKRFQNKIFI